MQSRSEVGRGMGIRPKKEKPEILSWDLFPSADPNALVQAEDRNVDRNTKKERVSAHIV